MSTLKKKITTGINSRNSHNGERKAEADIDEAEEFISFNYHSKLFY